MSQIFHRSTNTISKVSILGGLFIVAGSLWLLKEFNRSDYVTEAKVARAQPVPFSHKHHVAGMGIDCRYCHTSVETSSFAGIPPTQTCMNCHAQIWNQAPMLEPVRESLRSDRSIPWIRVNNLPDFVYFDHSIHVSKGVGCVTCHGPVHLMPLTWREHTLHMEWCLECHRQPELYVRPRDKVFDMEWKPEEDQRTLGARLVKEYAIERKTACSACHR